MRDALADRFRRWFSDLELPELLRAVDPHLATVPVLIRGVFYEGWNPSAVPVRYVDDEAFLTRIRLGCRVEPGPDPEPTARAVFNVLSKRVDAEEIRALKAGLPPGIRKLWP